MKFPRGKMRIIEVYDGQKTDNGWLELQISTVDLEGASKVYINLDDVLKLRDQKSSASDAAKKARELLGG